MSEQNKREAFEKVYQDRDLYWNHELAEYGNYFTQIRWETWQHQQNRFDDWETAFNSLGNKWSGICNNINIKNESLQAKLAEEIKISNERGQFIEQIIAEISALDFDNKSIQAQLTIAVNALDRIKKHDHPYDGWAQVATEALSEIKKIGE